MTSLRGHFNNRDLFEFLEIHSQCPTLLPYPLRKNVMTFFGNKKQSMYLYVRCSSKYLQLDAMDRELNIRIGKLELLMEGSAAHLLTKKIETIPHYVMDLSADGVLVAKKHRDSVGNPNMRPFIFCSTFCFYHTRNQVFFSPRTICHRVSARYVANRCFFSQYCYF